MDPSPRAPLHLREAALEALLVAVLMLAACALGVLIEHPASPMRGAVPGDLARRALFGAGMALTVAAIVYSPWGTRSGAHLNPSVTLAFQRLGRVGARDAAAFAVAQCMGAVGGVLAARALLGTALAHPSVGYIVTRPGPAGAAGAFAAELAIAFVLMSVVLAVMETRFARLTGLAAAACVFLFITFEAPISGMSMNPARSLGSALVAGDLRALWIYFAAPPMGMLAAALLRARAARSTGCAKLHHPIDVACIFCGQPGTARGSSVPAEESASLDGAVTGAALGVGASAVISGVLLPLAQGRAPQWSAAGLRALVPALLAWISAGAVLGALAPLVGRALARRRADGLVPALPPRRRVVILGGGFTGVGVARELERLLGADPTVEVTLVSETNALLFTPMLAEVAGSSLEPTHVSSPIRTALRRTEVIRGRVASLDLSARTVQLAPDPGEAPRALTYDHLVLALGAVTNWFGNAALERHALGFKSLVEAIRIRNRVIDLFERASRTEELARRRALLSFVVAGGGFAGVELAGALNDFARGILADFPSLAPEDLRVVLVHPGDRILPELSPALGGYAETAMTARGVRFKLGARITGARPGVALLDSGEELLASLLVWTAGARPHPLVAGLPVSRDRRGAVVVDEMLSVPGLDAVWAAGDCASVPAGDGRTHPPTAQVAIRAARRLAGNVHAALTGRGARPFRFESVGALCVVGHQTACAELRLPFSRRTVRFSGLLAWLLWRSIYLAKLPGLERKVRVCTDWLVELFFPRDTVQTLDLDERIADDHEVRAAPAEVKHAS